MKSRGLRLILPDGARRKLRNLTLSLGLALLFAVVIPDGLTKGNKYVGGRDTFFAVCVLCGLCFVVWVFSTDSVWSRLPLVGKAPPAFPPCRIAVRTSFALPLIELDSEEREGTKLLVCDLEVTNRQPDRDMHLVFGLRIQNEKFAKRPLSIKLFSYTPTTTKAQAIGILGSPLEVPPTKHLRGSLAYTDDIGRWIAYDDAHGFAASENCRLVMSAEDYVSGGKIELDVPGTWEST